MEVNTQKTTQGSEFQNKRGSKSQLQSLNKDIWSGDKIQEPNCDIYWLQNQTNFSDSNWLPFILHLPQVISGIFYFGGQQDKNLFYINRHQTKSGTKKITYITFCCSVLHHPHTSWILGLCFMLELNWGISVCLTKETGRICYTFDKLLLIETS